MSTALSKALDGKPVSDSAAPRALAEAAEKINKMKETLSVAKENAGQTVDAAIHLGEGVIVLGLSGAAEGYWGEEKMKLGPVPIRGALGVLSAGWGIANTVMGKPGGHQLAVGTALIGAEAYAMGRAGGVALREKRSGAAAGGAAGGAQPTQAQQALLQANPGSKLLNGKVVAANGAALEGDDLADLARLVRMQQGTEGERRNVRDGIVRARRA